ncbi:MAG: hypothetical protein PHO92_04900, partial [Candidatus Peribacteraceae bacterium]|nr:hypothetical protein [Candidatus Peribacteraceae bacterium]
TELQRHRLVSGVTALGFTVYRAQGQLYDSASGTPVNAAIDHNTKSIYLSKEIQFDTVGHELAEYMIRRLGPTDEVVRRGLELFGGNKEALSDAVGAYYAGRQLEQGVLAQLHRWLKELYAAFKNAVGAELSVEQVAAIINLEAMKLTEPTTASAAEFSFQYRKLYRGLGSGGRTVGGASFGAGVYMSSKEAVGKDYAMMAALKALPLEYTRAVDFLKQYGKERALAELHARALTITGNERTAAAKAIKLINDDKVTISASGEIGFSELKPRRLLTADVDVDALNWLRWYEPIPEAQLSAVAQQMQQEGLSTADLSPDVWKAQITGADLYDGLALQLALKKPEDIYQQEDIDYGKREASALLARAGINGIRYPTHTLMGGAVPESERGENFVIFTPGVLRNTETLDFQRRKPWQIPPGERRTTRPKAKESPLFRDVKEAMAWEDIARQVETPPAPVTPTQQARRLSDTARHAETYALWKRFIEPEVRAAFERTTSRDTGLSEEVLDNTALELISDPDKMTKLMAKALDPNQRQNLSHAEHRALNLYGAQRIESLRFSPEFLSRMDEDPVAASKWLLDQSKQLYELMEIDSRVQGQAFNMRKGWNTLEPLKLLAELDRELTPAERKELSAFFKKRFFTPEEIRSISNRITKPRARDLFTFFYGSNLITPGTQTVNAGSNFLNTMWLIGPGQLSEVAADAVLANPLVQAVFPGLKGYKRSKFVRGVWSGLRQTVSAEAVRPAYAQFKKAYANERPPFGDINKWEFYRGNPFRYAGLPRPLRVLAPFIGFNYRLLMAADIWFKVWARESRIASLRTNEAIRLGVPVEQIQITEEMRDDAKRFGADATFTMEPGKIIRSAHGIRNSIPFVGPLLTPFITTIGNITKSAVQRFPGLGVAVMKKDIEAQRYAKVMGRQIEGAVLTMMLLGLFWDRDDLIGAAPEEANKRDSFYRQGKQPYS